MVRDQSGFAARRVRKALEFAKQRTYGDPISGESRAGHAPPALRKHAGGCWRLGVLAAELTRAPSAVHLVHIIAERRKERRVRADSRSQQRKRTVDRELRLLVQRREPEPPRLVTLGPEFARASSEREQQRRRYRPRSNRKLSRSDRAMVSIDSLPAPMDCSSAVAALLNWSRRRKAFAP